MSPASQRGLSLRRKLLLCGVAGFVGLVLVRGADFPAEWLCLEDESSGTLDAAIVLAGDPGYERTRAAAELVVSGGARLLVLTGGEPGPGDSAESLRAQALAWGVDAERIRTETVSRSTRESMLALRTLLAREQVRSAAVITSPYHARRAVWTARRALPGLRLVSRPASPSFFTPRGWWRDHRRIRIVLSEYAKLAYYLGRGWV